VNDEIIDLLEVPQWGKVSNRASGTGAAIVDDQISDHEGAVGIKVVDFCLSRKFGIKAGRHLPAYFTRQKYEGARE